jgi:hypothetical protein
MRRISDGGLKGVGIGACMVAGCALALILGKWVRQATQPKPEPVPASQIQAPQPVPEEVRPKSPPPAPEPVSPRWIRVVYRELVDTNQWTQSGRPLGEVLSRLAYDRRAYGQVQPFLDRFSRLLPQALDATNGVAELPRSNLANAFPAGSPQPAWAALLRGGRILVTDDGIGRDGEGHASVFVPGDTPKQAYESSYGVLRHILATLVPPSPQPLRVLVYAYQNDYSACELKLCLDPYEVQARDFRAPAGKVPLDLEALEAFFAHCAELTGGAIDSSNGLVLAGKKGAPPTLAQRPVTLADLAVAYRAICHAGDNHAFVSLDPHPDPKLVRVNFGGFLEDTHIGWVVLEADKRFKTITSGLDPTSFEDLRSRIRSAMPSFATTFERELARPDAKRSGWEGTRFWYYPDAVEIQVSTNGRHCAVAKAQFTADAERLRTDFLSSADFEKNRKKGLSTAIRTNMQHLNEDYSRYAALFPELQELATVARLMGVCVWLSNSERAGVDLDALLGVELSAAQTPREKEQLISAAAADTGKETNLRTTVPQMVLSHLTPELTNTVSQVFSTDESLAGFLALTKGEEPEQGTNYLSEARSYRQRHGGLRLAKLMVDKNHLQAFAMARATALKTPAVRELDRTKHLIEAKDEELRLLRKEQEELAVLMERSEQARKFNEDAYASLMRRSRAAEDERERQVDLFEEKAMALSPRCHGGISGGIELGANAFNMGLVRETPLLLLVKQIADLLQATGTFQGVECVRSMSEAARSIPQPLHLGRTWTAGVSSTATNVESFAASSGSNSSCWRMVGKISGDWLDQSVYGRTATARHYHSSAKTLQVTEFEDGKELEFLMGAWEDVTVMRFWRPSRSDTNNLEIACSACFAVKDFLKMQLR